MCDWSNNDVIAGATVLYCLITLLIAVYAGFQLREVRRARELAILEEFLRRWGSDSMLRARREVEFARRQATAIRAYLNDLDQKNVVVYWRIIELANYFEDLAQKVLGGHLPEDLARHRMGPALVNYFSLLNEWITSGRDGDPESYTDFEKLASKWAPSVGQVSVDQAKEPPPGADKPPIETSTTA